MQITTNEAARRLKKTRQTIILAIHDERLPAKKIGRDWFIKDTDLEFIKDRRTKQYRSKLYGRDKT